MEFIDYINIGTGLLLIAVGWLCYFFPNLINPYGGMSPERKALVDINGLKKATAIILTITGILLIATGLLSALKVIDVAITSIVMMVLVLVMIVPLFVAMKKYNGFGRDKTGKIPSGINKPSKAVWVIIGLTMVFVAVVFAMSSRPQEIRVGDESVKISGIYGRDIPISEIVSVNLLDEMPPIAMRTNGSDTGKRAKGHFLLKNGEKCMIFIRYNMSPYIELRTTDNLYYLNCANKDETETLYQQLKTLKP